MVGSDQASRVVVDDSDHWRTFIAAPLAGALGVPLLPLTSAGLSNLDRQVLDQLNPTDLSLELADMASVLSFVDAGRISVVPAGSSDIIGMVNAGTPAVLHPQASLGPIESWIQAHALKFGDLSRVFSIKGPGELTTDQYWSLQCAVNGFRDDHPMGVSGQGLPVIRQPFAERPIGLARTDGAFIPGSEGPPDYWTAIGQTFRWPVPSGLVVSLASFSALL